MCVGCKKCLSLCQQMLTRLSHFMALCGQIRVRTDLRGLRINSVSLPNYSLQHNCKRKYFWHYFVPNSSSNPRTWIPVPIQVRVGGDSNLWLRYILTTYPASCYRWIFCWHKPNWVSKSKRIGTWHEIKTGFLWQVINSVYCHASKAMVIKALLDTISTMYVDT